MQAAVEPLSASSHPMSRPAQDLRRQSRGCTRAEPRDPDWRMLWSARAEWGREDYDHRNPRGLAGADFGRGVNSRPLLARECARDAGVAGDLRAGDAAFRKTLKGGGRRTGCQALLL